MDTVGRSSGPPRGNDGANRITETSSNKERPLHRLAEVRRQQGLSLRSAARQMSTDVRTLRNEEGGESDLKLSDLYRWQSVLGVPVAELLVEADSPLSRPVMDRARLVRIMKTVKAIGESAKAEGTKRMAKMLETQLVEIMPELKDVGPWHSVGQRRSLEEYGRAAERLLSEDSLYRADW